MKVKTKTNAGRAGGGWDHNHNVRKAAPKLIVKSKVKAGCRRGGWDGNHNARRM